MIARNINLLKWDNFFAGFWPLSTLLVVYFETITQSYATAMLVLAFGSIMTTATEIPMGLISDRLGRRKTLILAVGGMVLCYFFWALAGQVIGTPLLFLGATLFGMTSAATSGTDEALIYETMEELGQKEDFDILFSKSRTYNQIGIACGALSATVITYFAPLTLLAWFSVLPIVARFIVMFFYVEPKRSTAPRHGTSLGHFVIAWRQLIRNKRARFFAAVQMIDSSFGIASFRFESVYYSTLVSDWVVNITRFVKQVFGAFSFAIVPKIKKWGYARLFFGSLIGNTLTRLIGVVLNNVYAPFIMAAQNLFHGTGVTSSATILQNEFSPQQRATMKSIVSFGAGIFTAIAMYLLGVIADISTPRLAIAFAVAIKIGVIAVSLLILKKARQKLSEA